MSPVKDCKEGIHKPVSYTHLDVYKRQDIVLYSEKAICHEWIIIAFHG